MGMKPTQCLKALGRAHSYDLRRNECLRTGLLLGLIVSILPLACEVLLSGSGARNPLHEVRATPLLFIFLAHPLLFGLLFGAMGTIKRDLDRLHERDMRELSGLAMT